MQNSPLIEQATLFSKACDSSLQVSTHPRKVQNRLIGVYSTQENKPLDNEPDTDWALPQNQQSIQHVTCESNEAFSVRVKEEKIKRGRMLTSPPKDLLDALADLACNLCIAPVLAHGRLELLHYLRELNIGASKSK